MGRQKRQDLKKISWRAKRASDLQAIAKYKEQLETLEHRLRSYEAESRVETSAALRALVASVTVWPDYTFEIIGRLEELIGGKIYPSVKRWGTGGSGRGTRTPDPRIMIPVL